MTTQQPEALRDARWYMVNKDGMATLCTDRADAEKEAEDAQSVWPHRAVQLVDVASVAVSAESEPVAWRELCRRLYVELFYCNQQMTSGKRPKWQQGKTVRDVLADAKAALDAAPQPTPTPQADSQPAPAAVAGPSEMHEAMCPALTGGRCTCERNDPAVDKAWARFCGGIGDGPDAPYPGMISAFERYYSQSFTDKDWRNEASVWAAAWKQALLTAAAPTTQPAPQQEAQEPYSIDVDPQGIRALVADAITGALAFGAQGTNAPPDGHWLAPFWAAARAEREAAPVADLHPKTSALVQRFAAALTEKLAAAEKKYGYSDGWASPDWMGECRQKLVEHLAKGDPRDVAAYCAFLWHHRESTTAPASQGDALESEYQRGYRQGYEQRDAEVRGALV